MESNFSPREIVSELDKFIIGQKNAKRAVAVALRNRWRRKQLEDSLKEEIVPKNILMVGPTGCGKTEISRRLAKLANAPFIKVEATKFTEVGYVGRDVEQIIRDLVEISISKTKIKMGKEVRANAEKNAEERAQKTKKEENAKKERKFENFIWWDDSEKLAETEKEKHKWSTLTRYRFQRCLWKLKYNRIVSTFYLENLKRREGRWSWMIIVISTFTSGLTVANNVEDEPVDQYNTYVNASLTVSSMTVSLIAAWIKKQMFIERINETDKYLLNINALCEELEIQFALLNRDRIKYEDFKKKYIPEITKYLTTNPMIPPNEWKACIREITQKYPELVNPDNTQENKLWPWFGDYVLDTDDYGKKSVVRNPTTFMEHFKKTNTDRLRSSCCVGICKPKAVTNIY